MLGGKPGSSLLIDESSFPKQGERSVGVARQWAGRLGKVDNCQVAVFGVLTDGQRHTPVDVRLYLPKRWIEDPARCEQAGVPTAARELVSKSEHALDIVRQARARGMRFGWVSVDAGYGKEPAFLRALDDMKEVFAADGYANRRVVVFDSETGAYKRHWGAYGRPPSDDKIVWDPKGPPPQNFANPVHCITIKRNDLVFRDSENWSPALRKAVWRQSEGGGPSGPPGPRPGPP